MLNVILWQLFQQTRLKSKNIVSRVYPFNKMAVKLCDLTLPRKSRKFNLHNLRKISTGFKTAGLTPKSGILANTHIHMIIQNTHIHLVTLNTHSNHCTCNSYLVIITYNGHLDYYTTTLLVIMLNSYNNRVKPQWK